MIHSLQLRRFVFDTPCRALDCITLCCIALALEQRGTFQIYNEQIVIDYEQDSKASHTLNRAISRIAHLKNSFDCPMKTRAGVFGLKPGYTVMSLRLRRGFWPQLLPIYQLSLFARLIAYQQAKDKQNHIPLHHVQVAKAADQSKLGIMLLAPRCRPCSSSNETSLCLRYV